MSGPIALIAPPRPRRRDQARLLRQLLRTPQTALDEIRRVHGPVCGLGVSPMRMAVVGSPDAIREALMQPNDHYRYDSRLSPFPFAVGRCTMLAADGDDHRRRRGAVQHAFSRRRLNRWIPMIVERTDAAIDDLLAVVPRGTAVDLYPVGRRLLIDTVIRALVGERLVARTAEIDARFLRIQRYLSSPFYRQLPHPLPFTRRAAVRRDRRALDRLIDEAIAASRDDPTSGDGGDVIDALVHAGDLDDAEIRDQVKTLIGAGFDTTASSLAWTLWEATTHPAVWQRLREEADQVLGPAATPRTLDDATLPALRFAHRTMRETLRLHPASGIAVRQVARRIELDGFTLSARTFVVWSPYLAGRDPAVWSDPERFDPDRFAEVDPEQRRLADEAWVPFGRGPRMCVGFALAQMELTLVLARMAQRLDLTPTAPRPPEPVGLVVSQPTGGARMFVRSRPA